VREVMGIMERDKVREKAIKSFINSTPDSTPPPAPSEHKRKKYDPIPPATQALIVQKMLYEGGSLTWDKACDMFGVSRASISQICGKEKRKQDGNDVVVPKKQRRKSPLSLKILTFVLSLLEEESQLILKELVACVEAQYPIYTSISALDKALKKITITWKNVLPMLTCWNFPDVIRKRQEMVHVIARLKLQNIPIFYADETGFNLHTKNSKGRAVAGEKTKLTLVLKGKRVTVIAAIGTTGFVHHRIVVTGASTLAPANEPRTKRTTAEHFRAFLLDLCGKLPRNCALFIDNCKIHHVEKLTRCTK
jgi:transposase